MKKLILLFLATLICISANAQDANLKSKIIEIKRNKNYFYAECTSQSEAEAKEAATIMLKSFVSDHNKSTGSSIDFDALDVQYINWVKEDYYRTLAYARKDGAPITKSKPMTAPEPVIETTPEPVVETTPEPEPVIIPEPEIETAPEPEIETTSEPEPVIAPEPEIETTPEPVVAPAPVTKPTPKTTMQDYSDLGLQKYQQDVINSLMECYSFEEIASKLSRYKNEYKIKKYGTYEDCSNIASCFWIVINRDSNMSLNTILSTGNDKTNLKTSLPDSLTKYTGNILIWFRF